MTFFTLKNHDFFIFLNKILGTYSTDYVVKKKISAYWI